MSRESILFVVLFSSFVVGFSFLGLLPYNIPGEVKEVPQCTDNGCNEVINQEGFKIAFPKDGIIPTTNEGLQQHPEAKGPSQEEWISILSALDDGREPQYMRHHGFDIHQVVTGVYNYSYGNDGTYQGELFGRIDQRGRHGQYASFYYQKADGETGPGPIHYTSGFALFRFYIFSLARGGAVSWHGEENGFYLNKNPDGSYTIFGYSKTGSEGKAVVKRKDTLDVSMCSTSIMNTTTFASKTLVSSNFTLKFNGKEELLRGTLQAVTGPAGPAAETALLQEQPKPQSQTLLLQNSGFSMNTTLTFKGYFPRGSGDFKSSAKGTIRSSVFNSTLVISGKGHTWIGKEALSTPNLRTLLDSNLWLSL